MRFAFDVKGTIEGPKKKQVLELFRILQALGHTCDVWSNSYGFAVDCVKSNKLNAAPTSKQMKMDLDHDETKFYDVAIEDDTQQTWLAARRFVWVKDLPESMEAIEVLAHQLIGRKVLSPEMLSAPYGDNSIQGDPYQKVAEEIFSKKKS